MNTELREQTLIGIAVSGNKNAWLDLTQLQPYHFMIGRHADLWALIQDLRTRHGNVDQLTVADQMVTINTPGSAPIEPDYLFHCADKAFSSAYLATQYVHDQIVDYGNHQLQQALTRGQQLAQASTDANATLTGILSDLKSLNLGTPTEETTLLDALTNMAEEVTTGTAAGHPTDYADLNALIGGLAPGRLYIIGARPAVGKSLLSLGLGMGLMRHGQVSMSSLEMSVEDNLKRVLSIWGVGDMASYSQGANPNFGQALKQMAPDVSQLPLSIDARTNVTIDDICAYHHTQAQKHGQLAGIIVDYLTLINHRPNDKRNEASIYGSYSRRLKALAGELHCPVICVAQLNRMVESRPDGTPRLSDLRESGAIEQDADVVMLLSLPLVDGMIDEGMMNVDVAKNRHGRTGRVQLVRDGLHATLKNYHWTGTPQ